MDNDNDRTRTPMTRPGSLSVCPKSNHTGSPRHEVMLGRETDGAEHYNSGVIVCRVLGICLKCGAAWRSEGPVKLVPQPGSEGES